MNWFIWAVGGLWTAAQQRKDKSNSILFFLMGRMDCLSLSLRGSRGRANHEIHFFFSLVVGYGRSSANGSAKKRKQRRNEWMSEWWPAEQRTESIQPTWMKLSFLNWRMKWKKTIHELVGIDGVAHQRAYARRQAQQIQFNFSFSRWSEKKSEWICLVGFPSLFLFLCCSSFLLHSIPQLRLELNWMSWSGVGFGGALLHITNHSAIKESLLSLWRKQQNQQSTPTKQKKLNFFFICFRCLLRKGIKKYYNSIIVHRLASAQ